MRFNPYPIPVFRIFAGLLSLGLGLTSCSFLKSSKSQSGSKQGASTGVLGASLGELAEGEQTADLALVHATTSTHAPAPVRPDPDTMVRNLLLQYRESGSTVAREIGRVESFRMLLGGANVTFTVTPQETYDSTSLLAEMKVANEICRSLVDPSGSDHPGWTSILPSDASKVDDNLSFLAQRILGIPSERIEADTLTTLKAIVNTAKENGAVTKASYIPACTTLILDAEALLL